MVPLARFRGLRHGDGPAVRKCASSASAKSPASYLSSPPSLSTASAYGRIVLMHGRVLSIFPSAVTGRATKWIDGFPCSATAAMNPSCRSGRETSCRQVIVEFYLDRVLGFESQGSAHRRRQHHAQPVLFFGAQVAYLCPRRLRHHLVGLQRDGLQPVLVWHEQHPLAADQSKFLRHLFGDTYC